MEKINDNTIQLDKHDIAKGVELFMQENGFTGTCNIRFRIKTPYFGEPLMTFPKVVFDDKPNNE
jgi:hypothetical protein